MERSVNSLSGPSFVDLRAQLRKGLRKILALPRRLSRPGRPCTAEEARTILTLVYARPFSEKACREQTKYRARSVLMYALATSEHLLTVLPDFVTSSGANTRAASLSFSESDVRRASNIFLGKEDVAEAGGDGEALSWARAYERFWARIFAAGLSERQIRERLGSEAEKPLRRLEETLAACAEVDALVADSKLERAFVTARLHLESGLGAVASRYAALAFVHSGSAFDIDYILSQLSGLLPPGFARRLWSLLQERSSGLLPEGAKPLGTLEAYLPPIYARLAPLGAGSVEEAIRTKSLWALLSRQTLRRDDPPQREALVASPPAEAGARRSATVVDERDARVLRTAIRSLPAEADSEAPVLLLTDPVDVPETALPLFAHYFHADEVVPVIVHTVSRHPGAQWLAGDWTLASSFAGVLCGSIRRARALESALDETFLSQLLNDSPEPLALYRAAAQETNETKLPELEAVVVSEEYSTGRFSLTVRPDATCEIALQLIDELAAKEGLEPTSPVVVTAPDVFYPSGYSEFMVTCFERGGRRTAVALCDVVVDQDLSLRIVGVDTNTPVIRTSLIALSCMSLADLRRSLELQPGVRFYGALALPALPATPVHHRLDLIGASSETLERVRRRLADDLTAKLIHERSRLPLISWITGSGSQLIPIVRGYNTATKRYWAAQTALSRLIQGPIDAKLAGETHYGVTNGWLDMLLDEHREDLVDAFLGRVFSNREYLQHCSTEEFLQLTETARRLGRQSHYAELLLPHVIFLCFESPHLTVEIFSFMVGAVDEPYFYALLMAAASACFNRRENGQRSMHRLTEVASRYCDAPMMALFLETVSRSRQSRMLKDPEILRKLGCALRVMDDSAGNLAALGISVTDIRNAAPIEHRITFALSEGADRTETLSLLCRFTEENRDLIELADIIRPYSRELSRLSITYRDWPYFLHGEPDAVLAIAAILGDKEQIERMLPLAGNAELIAMARARSGEWEALDEYYGQLAEPLGITPLRFRGNSIGELFEHLAGQPSKREAQPMAARVTVIMTAWNPSIELVRLSLRSVIQQTHGDFELFLVDDGSDPNLAERLAAAAEVDERIRYIRLPKNVGPYMGRNLVLEQASGEFIAIQDADDFSHPDRFAVQLRLFAEHPSLMACASRHLRFDLDGQLQLEHDFQLRGDGTMSSMFRRSAFELTGPFVPVRSRGDVEFRERVKKAFGPHAYRELACPLVFCFSGPATLSHSTRRNQREQLQAFRRAFRAREWRMTPEGPKPLGDVVVPWALRP